MHPDDPNFPIDAYTESKVRAERAAWGFLESLPEEERCELCTVNPTLVQVGELVYGGCLVSARKLTFSLYILVADCRDPCSPATAARPLTSPHRFC